MTIRFALFLAVVPMAGLAQESRSLAQRDPRYVIQPNDVLEVRYRYTPEYDQVVTVQPDGFVSLNLAGDMKAGGLTVDQVRERVMAAAGKRLREPELTILLKEFEKPHFVVMGEVVKPGRYDMQGETSIVEALAISGGLKDSAKHSQVIIFRRTSDDRAETRLLNVKNLLKSTNLREAPVLRSGDLVVVPQNRVSKIERFVKWGTIGVYAPLGR